MGDYLRHIAARVVGRTGIVPRLPSLYEPPSGGTGARLETVSTGVTVEAPRRTEAPPERMPARAVEELKAQVAEEPRRPMPENEAPPRVVKEHRTHSVERVLETRATRVAEIKQPEPVLANPRPAPADLPTFKPTDGPRRGPDDIVRPEIQRARETQPLDASPQPPSSPRLRTPIRENPQPRASARVESARPAERTAAALKQSYGVFTKNPPPVVAAMVPAAAEDRVPPIQVTIGRVTVNAVLPSAAPPRQTAGPAPPRLSLDSYLEQRGGRR